MLCAVFTLKRPFYPASVVQPVSVLILYPGDIPIHVPMLLWSQTVRQRKTENKNGRTFMDQKKASVPGTTRIQQYRREPKMRTKRQWNKKIMCTWYMNSGALNSVVVCRRQKPSNRCLGAWSYSSDFIWSESWNQRRPKMLATPLQLRSEDRQFLQRRYTRGNFLAGAMEQLRGFGQAHLICRDMSQLLINPRRRNMMFQVLVLFSRLSRHINKCPVGIMYRVHPQKQPPSKP